MAFLGDLGKFFNLETSEAAAIGLTSLPVTLQAPLPQASKE